jgi:hypothetical protein
LACRPSPIVTLKGTDVTQVTVIVDAASLFRLAAATVPKLRLLEDNAVQAGVTVALTPIEVERVPAKTGLHPRSMIKIANNHLLYLLMFTPPVTRF